jgi:alkanesulfonate monooxygenase SsuD/methylene tetrahydromethanopterin reductase-like flavin-dependent oxidoreductase (luciferase family)
MTMRFRSLHPAGLAHGYLVGIDLSDRWRVMSGRVARNPAYPLRPGGIPLWIAGGGEKVTLKIAVKYARYTNFDGTLDAFRHKSQLLARHCSSVGTDLDAIGRSSNDNVAIGSTGKRSPTGSPGSAIT